jgi:hypothetical protein
MPDVHHHRQSHDIGKQIEIVEQIIHPRRLRTDLLHINPVCFDSTIKPLEFLTQGFSFMWSQTHAYELGLAGLMLGGKDRLC